MNTEKLWSEVYKREDYQPAWSKPGMDKNLLHLIEKNIGVILDREHHILDIGCGNGRNSRLFDNYETNFINYSGIDFAEEAINYCKKTYKKTKVFKCLNITETLPSFNKTFDILLDLGCFHSIPPEKRKAYIKNIVQLSSANSTLILGTWLKENSMQDIIKPSYSPYVILDEWFFSRDDIQSLFSPFFKVTDTLIDKDIYPGINDGFLYTILKRM